ncbi:MAG: hypothetical protein JWP63_6632 [Candidatus Solibacter sp.]|jgi:hypothetical protein|nr:hypothetical protein [Candidatus Solibacter sp.]
MKTLAALFALAAIALLWPRQPDPLPGFPHVFLWAWERPENLDFIDPRTTGVAFLARTVSLRNARVSVQPRLNPLRYTPGATLIAVVRVESDRSPLPSANSVATAITDAASIPGISALQVDFDATLSQRAFYRDVLERVRRDLPAGLPLSITALASWCESDHWIDGLPVAEAVPMLFRMGPGAQPAREFRPALCRSSAGTSTDEPLHAPPTASRLYIFNPRPWTRADFDTAVREVRRWH